MKALMWTGGAAVAALVWALYPSAEPDDAARLLRAAKRHAARTHEHVAQRPHQLQGPGLASGPQPAASSTASAAPQPDPRRVDPKGPRKVLGDLERRVRYGRLGQPIRGVDPIVDRAEPEIVAAQPGDGDEGSPTIWSTVSGKTISPTETITVEAWTEAGAPTEALTASLVIFHEGQRQTLRHVPLTVGGAGVSGLLSGEGLTEGDRPQVQIHTAEGRFVAAHGLRLTAERAHLTGIMRDALHTDALGQHLEIEAEVELLEAGPVHLGLTLYTASGAPVGYAEIRRDLPPGRHWLPVIFGGPLLCDAGEGGPYTVAHAQLTDVKAWPGQPGPRVDDAHVTKAWPASSFSCEGIGDSRAERHARVYRQIFDGAAQPR